MMKLIISLLLITSVSFAQNQSNVPQQPSPLEEALKKSDPALQPTDEMSRVKDSSSDCPSCMHSALLNTNLSCETDPELCAKGYNVDQEKSKAQEGTN